VLIKCFFGSLLNFITSNESSNTGSDCANGCKQYVIGKNCDQIMMCDKGWEEAVGNFVAAVANLIGLIVGLVIAAVVVLVCVPICCCICCCCMAGTAAAGGMAMAAADDKRNA